ncbi:DUF177 domain-containing protein [Ferrimicrobium sp.]|uniref:YceD family protein n=1 Tax=Ferrimicrobium sp. TaxID=2926050 RepID=UPI002601F352|nr:DUF177 domain-containing protein [Ferrimicrobium sp.]
MHDFEISVAHLLRGSERASDVVLQGNIPGLFVTSSRILDDAVIRVDGRVEAVGEGLLVSLEVHAEYVGECVRCLGEMHGELAGRSRELFIEGEDTEEHYGFRGETLDLRAAVSDLCVLGLPPVPLCREDCKGLCQYCGADLNEGPCGCTDDSGDPRWAALDQL